MAIIRIIKSRWVINRNFWCPEPEIIITILSDKGYMEILYFKMLNIRQFTKK